MKPRGDRRPKHASKGEAQTSPCSRAANRLKIQLIALVLLALGAAAILLQRSSRAPSLPDMDLSNVEPAVSTNLNRHFNEVRQNPKSGSTWGRLGALLWAYDFRPAAAQCLEQAARLEPENPRWPYFQALCFAIAQPSDAIPLLRKAVSLCGSSPEAPRFRLAEILAEQGQWKEALAEAEMLLKDHPDFAPARLLAARASHSLRDPARAIDLARVCVDDPRTARVACLFLATLHREQGDPAVAAQFLSRASSLPQDMGLADPYRSEVNLLRGDPRVLCEDAHPLIAAGRIQEAAALVDQLREKHPGYPETWLLVGRLQYLRKDLAGAEASLRRHVALEPRSAQGFFQLGSVLLAREQFVPAAEAFGQATALKPDFGPAYYNRGVALGRAGQTAAALSAFEESLRHNPERFETYVLLADLHLRSGNATAAAAAVSRAELLNADDSRLKVLRERLRQMNR